MFGTLLKASEPTLLPWEEEYVNEPVFASYDPDKSMRREFLAAVKREYPNVEKLSQLQEEINAAAQASRGFHNLVERLNNIQAPLGGQLLLDNIDSFKNREFFYTITLFKYLLENPKNPMWQSEKVMNTLAKDFQYIEDFYSLNDFDKYFVTMYYFHLQGRKLKSNVSGIVDRYFNQGIFFNYHKIDFVKYGHSIFDYLSHVTPHYIAFSLLYKESSDHFEIFFEDADNKFFNNITVEEQNFRYTALRRFALNMADHSFNPGLKADEKMILRDASIGLYADTLEYRAFNTLENFYLSSSSSNIDVTVEWHKDLLKKPHSLLTADEIALSYQMSEDLLRAAYVVKEDIVNHLFKKKDVRDAFKNKKNIKKQLETSIDKSLHLTREALDKHKRSLFAKKIIQSKPEVPEVLQKRYNEAFDKSLKDIKDLVNEFLKKKPEFKPMFADMGIFTLEEQKVDQDALKLLDKKYDDILMYDTLKSNILATEVVFAFLKVGRKADHTLLNKCNELLKKLRENVNEFDTLSPAFESKNPDIAVEQAVSKSSSASTVREHQAQGEEVTPYEPTTMIVKRENRLSKRLSSRAPNPNPTPYVAPAPQEYIYQAPESKSLDPAVKAKQEEAESKKKEKKEKRGSSIRRFLRNSLHLGHADQEEKPVLNPKGERIASQKLALEKIEIPQENIKEKRICFNDMDVNTFLLWQENSTDPLAPKIKEILNTIDEAKNIATIKEKYDHGKNYEVLKSHGNLNYMGKYSPADEVHVIRVNKKMRICFVWDTTDQAKPKARKVLYTNYH